MAAKKYLGGDPELIILDSSHEYQATLAELDLWYAALAPGGLLALHDVSRFAADFDVTQQGGVGRAFTEWRKSASGRGNVLPERRRAHDGLAPPVL